MLEILMLCIARTQTLRAFLCDMQCILDLNFSSEIPVTFHLTSGSGPVYITGAHLIGMINSLIYAVQNLSLIHI